MFFYLKRRSVTVETVEAEATGEFGKLVALRHSILHSQAAVVALRDKPGKELTPDDIAALAAHRWLNG